MRPFLHLAKLDLGWKELPPLVEVQNDPEKVELVLSRIKSWMASSSQTSSGKSMQDMLKLFELILQFVLDRELSKEPNTVELDEVLQPVSEINQVASAIEPALPLEISLSPVAVAMNNALLVPIESMQPALFLNETSLKARAEVGSPLLCSVC